MRIIAEAPYRVDLAGGTLDIWPLYLFHPGAATVNFAINRHTRCAIETLGGPEIRVRSNDLDAAENFRSLAELDRTARPRLPLAAHLLRFFRPGTGLAMRTDSEAPAGVRRVAIPVDLDDFNRRIVLCYTGAPPNSGINNWEVAKAYIDGERKIQRNFEHIASIASSMRVAVKKGDWTEAGRLLREEWSHRRKNAPGISTPVIDRLIALARRAGSLGAKVCGAGGGGCVFFLVERGAQATVSRAVANAGGVILPVQVAARGVTIRTGRGI
jgi:galactokinase/mevalonate kinase-like predicted kinase